MPITCVDKENRVSPKKISLLDPGNMTVTTKQSIGLAHLVKLPLTHGGL